jgi:hypothetical protein
VGSIEFSSVVGDGHDVYVGLAPSTNRDEVGPTLSRSIVMKGATMKFIIIGNIGSDAGYWVLDSTGLHHVGGWGVDGLLEVSAGLNILREATRLKTPGLAEGATKTIAEFVQRQLGAHIKELGQSGTVVVVA